MPYLGHGSPWVDNTRMREHMRKANRKKRAEQQQKQRTYLKSIGKRFLSPSQKKCGARIVA